MTGQQEFDRLERMEKKLEFQPNKQYLPLVWPSDISRGDGNETICVNCGESYRPELSGAGQPHRFCNRKCEIGFWKVETLAEGI